MSDTLGFELWGHGKKLAECSPLQSGGWYWYTLTDGTNSLNTTGSVATREEAQERFTFGVHSLAMLEHTRASLLAGGFTVLDEVTFMPVGKKTFELHTLVAVAPKHAPVKFTRAGGL
jgi:hypothetical protein